MRNFVLSVRELNSRLVSTLMDVDSWLSTRVLKLHLLSAGGLQTGFVTAGTPTFVQLRGAHAYAHVARVLKADGLQSSCSINAGALTCVQRRVAHACAQLHFVSTRMDCRLALLL